MTLFNKNAVVPASDIETAVETAVGVTPEANKAVAFPVRNIWEVKGGYARVSIANEVFDNVRGMTPKLPYKTTKNALGQGMRVFTIGGVELMTRYDKETRKTLFIMKQSDAVANLQTLADERSGEVAVATDL